MANGHRFLKETEPRWPRKRSQRDRVARSRRKPELLPLEPREPQRLWVWRGTLEVCAQLSVRGVCRTVCRLDAEVL